MWRLVSVICVKEDDAYMTFRCGGCERAVRVLFSLCEGMGATADEGVGDDASAETPPLEHDRCLFCLPDEFTVTRGPVINFTVFSWISVTVFGWRQIIQKLKDYAECCNGGHPGFKELLIKSLLLRQQCPMTAAAGSHIDG